MKKSSERVLDSDINELCDQAGCSPRQKALHAWKWELKRWHAHPSPEFSAWWEPFEFDPESGAHVGGHPEARRKWARKDPGRWVHRWYGVSVLDAWNTDCFVSEFEAWQSAGSPEREPFISLAATLERQKQFWHDLKPIIDKIGKPMPKPMPDDYDLHHPDELEV